jgi:hypothetical protein
VLWGWNNLQYSMSVKVFITQDVIDNWMEGDRVQVTGDVITFAAAGASARLVPAYHFVRMQAGDDGQNRLLGRVKVNATVLALGAEAYMNSVTLGENAYEVEPGFVVRPVRGTRDEDLLRAVARESGL